MPNQCDCAAALLQAADAELAEADRLQRNRATREYAANTRRTGNGYAKAAGWLKARARK